MDGYLVKLDEICDLADEYDAMVMVDDSHATGYIGRTGRGTPEHCGVQGRVDIITSTLGKALGGASGGYTTGRQEIIDLLRQRSRPYLFSNTLTPSLTAAGIAVFKMLSATTELRDKLMKNTRYFRSKLEKLGFDVLAGETAIVPVMLYDAKLASDFANEMLAEGIYVIGFSYPGGSQGAGADPDPDLRSARARAPRSRGGGVRNGRKTTRSHLTDRRVGSVAPPEDAWTDWGGDGPQLVLTHANGFPPETYRTTIEALMPHFTIATFSQRPLWSAQDPQELRSWRPMAGDLAAAIRARAEGPVVAVGHSLGGVLCALAAARNPELFSALVLLDPVIFTGLHAFSWGWMKRLGLGRHFPLVEGAARRRDAWPDRSAVRASWSRKSVFKRWDPRVLDDYIETGVIDGPERLCDPEVSQRVGSADLPDLPAR